MFDTTQYLLVTKFEFTSNMLCRKRVVPEK